MPRSFAKQLGLRQHFLESGVAKKTYSEETAQAKARRLHQWAYKCGVCNGWHLAKIRKNP